MKALCIGSAMVDIIVLVASRDVERMTMHNATSSFLLIEQGRKVEAENISAHVGGGAVNAAVSMRRAGVEAAVLAKIGQDDDGARVRERLATEGIADDALACAESEATGTAVMISAHDRNASIFTRRGANTTLVEADIPAERFAGRDLVHIAPLSNRSADRFGAVVERASEAGAFVAANPGIRQLTSRSRALFAVMPRLDLLAVNRVEAEALVPALEPMLDDPHAAEAASERLAGPEAPRLLRNGLSFGGFDIGLFDFLHGMRAQGGLARMLVTDGAEGAYLADADGVHYCPGLREGPVRGTAGAGDAFVSTAAVALAGGASVAEALRRAAVNAAAVVGVVDANSGLLDGETLAREATAQADALPLQSWSWSDMGLAADA